VNNEIGKYHPTVCLKKLRNISKDPCQDCNTPDQDLMLEMVQICPCIARYNAKHNFLKFNLEEKGKGQGNSDKKKTFMPMLIYLINYNFHFYIFHKSCPLHFKMKC
jgi:hypothetical protein